MFSRYLRVILTMVLAGTALSQSPLRVCADPDNLPFSNSAEQGFDIEIAKLIAHNLHRTPVFVWTRSRRGFVREQFNKNACDLLVGIPSGMRGVTVSDPYYTSSYVFVTPAKQHLQISSVTDPQLDQGRIGLQILEEDLSPPSIPLIRSGHASQLIGFDGFGSHEGDVVRAVSNGKVGVAVVWGPVAGYYSQHSSRKLTLTQMTPLRDPSGMPFAYRIGFGVHKSDSTLLKQLNGAITALQPQIQHVLVRYHVPVLRAEDVP